MRKSRFSIARIVMMGLVAYAALLPEWARAADDAGVLILGDSNSEGPFGATLYDRLRVEHDPVTTHRLKVSIFAKCGAGAHDWINKDYAKFICGAWTCSSGRKAYDCPHLSDGAIPPLHELYDGLHADRLVTIAALGVNMLWGDRKRNLQDVSDLIAVIHAEPSACIWIGPPQTGDQFVTIDTYESFVADLRKVVLQNGCRFISSEDKTDRRNISPKEDHYSDDDSAAWANGVLQELHHPLIAEDKPLLSLFLRSNAIARK